MQLGNGDRSNVEDRRGLGGTGLKLGLGGTLVVAVLSLLFRQNLFAVIDQGGGGVDAPAASGEADARKAGESELEQVAVASFNDAQGVWDKALGQRWEPARLVLFWDGTRSGCGDASSAMGPFYCPADQKVYIDLGFYRELDRRFGAPGDLAQAYVIAHEVGHHVQHLLGIDRKMRAAQDRSPQQANALSVRLELQADCLAGIWARTVADRGLLDVGDLEEAIGAAAAVGDDRLQKAATGEVHAESFTHGSAAQRTSWFRRGYDTTQLTACDTFSE
ncbi:MAG: neutral zinc metallopeptidase [Anaeromyxobacter sp.]